MSPALLRRLLREAFAALRPGGLVLVEAAHAASWLAAADRLPRDGLTGALAPDELRRRLEEAGFTDVSGDLAALEPPPLALPEVELVSKTLRGFAENFRRLNDLLFPPPRHYAVGRRPDLKDPRA